MATPKQFKKRGRWSLVIGVLLAALTFGSVAWGDVTVPDGDGVAPVAANAMSFGSIDCGATTTKTALIAIKRDGNYGTGQVFKDGTTATISVQSVSITTGDGLDAVMDASPATISIPSNWDTAPNNTPTTAVPSTVTVDSSTPGAGSGIVTYRATGTQAKDGSTMTRDNTMNVSWTVLDNCAPPNTAPPDPGAPYLDAGSTTPNNTGDFTVDWIASTDPDAGDTVTYELQKHNASTSTWTSVATGLTTNSYTFTGEAEGSWVYRVQASDNHGALSGWATDASAIVVVDKTAPSAPTGDTDRAAEYTSGSDSWWKDSVTVSFSDNGDPALADTSLGSGVASVTGSQTFDSSNANASTGAFSLTGYATDYATNESTGTTVSGFVDWKSPTVSVTPTPAAAYTDGSGHNWWKDTVSFTVAASDPAPASGLGTDPSGTLGPFTASGTIAAQTAVDNVGHSTSSDPVDYYVDATAPTFGDCTGGPFLLNSGSHTVSITAQDESGGSGLDTGDSTLTGTVGTSSVGSQTVTFTAYDNVGHHPTKTCTYSVVYDWTGFFQPVNNLTDLQPWNSAKAGSAIPVKFNLGGNQGTSIFLSGYPKVSQVACPSGGTVTDPIETYTSTAGGSTLTYDTTAMQYVYVWKTDKAWAGKCFLFQLGLNDGTTHNFEVQFTK